MIRPSSHGQLQGTDVEQPWSVPHGPAQRCRAFALTEQGWFGPRDPLSCSLDGA